MKVRPDGMDKRPPDPKFPTQKEVRFAHDLLNWACHHAHELGLSELDMERVGAAQNTLCWVLGCPNATRFAENLSNMIATLENSGLMQDLPDWVEEAYSEAAEDDPTMARWKGVRHDN